ncbi:Tautomerase/MIF superfamily [Tirmania nivea]|nr:Tautomerase/MIF superfamily [Tirmania nivea]
MVEIIRDSGRATPADPSSLGKKSSKSDLKSRKNGHAYYNDAFAVREDGKKVPAAAGVWVEMKTNVILENEFDFIKSFSQVIAKRFSRTEETVAVSIDHSSCMMMGGTFDGCYLLTITSLSFISPTCNKRNVALISEWLSANLGVPSSRGFIRFVEPDAGNYAMGGITCLDMLEKERSSTRMSMASTDGSADGRARKGFLSGRMSRMDKLDENRPPSNTVCSMDSGRETVQSTYAEKAAVKRGRSMFNLFGRSQRIPAESQWS